MPSSPLLFNKFPEQEACSAAASGKQSECALDPGKFCGCLHTLEISMNDVVELVIVDGGTQGENHPIHLHGHSFAVLGIEKASFIQDF